MRRLARFAVYTVLWVSVVVGKSKIKVFPKAGVKIDNDERLGRRREEARGRERRDI